MAGRKRAPDNKRHTAMAPSRSLSAAAIESVAWRRGDQPRLEQRESTTMKSTTKLLIPILTLGTAASLLMAPEERPPREPVRPGGPGGPGGGRMMMPIVAALDPNGDGVIDATEIANATAAL